jgi:hypothetical protein
MKLILKITLLLTFIITSGNLLQAQELYSRVPADVNAVLTLNLGTLNTKANFAEASKLEIFQFMKQADSSSSQEFMSSLSHLMLGDLAEKGLNTGSKAYIYFLNEDSTAGMGITAGLSNASAFETLVKNRLFNGTPPEIKEKNGIRTAVYRRMGVSWNNEMMQMIVLNKMTASYYGFDYSEEYDENDYSADVDTALMREAIANYRKDSIQQATLIYEVPAPRSDRDDDEDIIQVRPEISDDETREYETPKSTIYRNYYDRLVRERKQEKKNAKLDERRAVLLAARIDELNSMESAKSVASSENFVSGLKRNSDIYIWVDYNLHKLYIKPMLSAFGNRNKEEKPYNGLFANQFLHFDFMFENGRMDMDSRYFMNDRMAELTKGAYNGKVNKKFLKYIPGKTTQGFVAFASNPEKATEAYLKLVREMFGEMGQLQPGRNYSEVAMAAFDFIEMMVNKDVLYHTFKGDALFAITDMKEEEISYTTYDYNENYEQKEKTNTRKELRPSFLLMATLDKKEYLQRVLNIIERLEGIKKFGNYYTIPQAKKLGGFTVYIAIENDILFIGNDGDLFMNRLSKGYDKSEQLSSGHKKLITKNSMSMHWDVAATLKQLLSSGPEMMKSGPIGQAMTLANAQVKNIEVKGWDVKGNKMEAHATLRLNDESTNSLLAGLKFINQIYVNMKNKN